MLEETTNVIKNLDPAVKSVNASLEKVQVPLDTVIKYSHTLDDMHDRTVDSVARMAENASDSVDKMKDYVVGKLQSLDNYDEVRPYNPETDK
jgi:ABC-type transporter Mla subunit MlaD